MQNKFKRSSHTYRINSIIDLDGGTLTIPYNSILDFTGGGKITNGSVVFNNTLIIPNGCILDRYITATLTGSFGKGQCLYDADLGKPKWWNGTEWVDATGTSLETSNVEES